VNLSHKINFHEAAKFFGCRVLELGEKQHRRVVDPCVDAPETLDRRLRDFRYLIEIGDVADFENRLAPTAARRFSSTSDCRPSSSRAAATTFAPNLPKSSAAARPMPLEAPVITTTCSLIGFNFMMIAPFVK